MKNFINEPMSNSFISKNFKSFIFKRKKSHISNFFTNLKYRQNSTHLILKSNYGICNLNFDSFLTNPLDSNSFFLIFNEFFNVLKLRDIRKSLKEIFRLINLGFFSSLEIKGLGYKFSIINSYFYGEIGKTHSAIIILNSLIEYYEKKGKIIFFSGNLEILNTNLMAIRSLRIPDSYKGKGVLFNEEVIKLKPGKKKS